MFTINPIKIGYTGVMKRIFTFLLTTLIFLPDLMAQTEHLEPLRVNPQIYRQAERAKFQAAPRSGVATNLRYLIEPLELPVVDDFSTNKMKRYDGDVDDPSNIDSVAFRFLVNGVFIDTLRASFDTTFSFIKNTATNSIDTFANSAYTVTFFDDFDPIGSAVMWPAESSFIDGQNVTVTALPTDTVIPNRTDTICFVLDDGFSYYVDEDSLITGDGEGAFINRNYPIDPPTIGVVTFDGLDASGYPYNFINEQAQGEADILTSKPIQLDYSPADSIYFSFYYQSKGRGYAPNKFDSIVLHFYSPVREEWISVWSFDTDTLGDTVLAFREVNIPITDTIFLADGFRFRFKNYATLSGNTDHWHIDYIYLDKDRTFNDDVKDVAISQLDHSFIKQYTSMPWKHFVQNINTHMADNYEVEVRNLSSDVLFNNNRYFVEDASTSNQIFASDPSLNNETGFPAFAELSFLHTVNTPGNNFQFPGNTNDRQNFDIEVTTHSPTITAFELISENDSIVHEQVFDTYYAYDDGSAEVSYSLSGQGAQLAYEFNIDVTDTLKAVYLYFLPNFVDVSGFPFRLIIWSDLDPETVIYSNTTVDFPIYSETNEFVRYELDSNIVLSGKFFIGWQQIGDEKLRLGFDRNIDNGSKIAYNTTGTWLQSKFEGSLMMRPDFGVPPPPPVGVEQIVTPERELTVKLYPNPAKDRFRIDITEGFGNALQMQLIDLSGRIVLNQQVNHGEELSVGHLASGMYLVRLEDRVEGKVATSRLVLSR